MTTEDEKTTQLKRALQAIKELRARLEHSEQTRREPIAVIGMACRFPGDANTPEDFWRLLENRVDAITPVPAERWNAAALFDADADAPGRINTRWGGFLKQVEQFDAPFFGISPREAARMDPQQRLMLEVAWETLEDAGIAVQKLGGSRTGVFIGVHSHSADYYQMQTEDSGEIDVYTGTGTSHSVISGRLSYLWDLQGPAVSLDTACSSSLVAVHLAVQSLRSGDSDLALAGGVNVMLTPEFTMVASRMRMMAADGRCKAFDSRADGFVRSEGCGAVLLKRLSDAQRDGDRILAVIRGSAINQDGHSNGLTAPNGLSQQDVIRRALENAGVKPAQVGYVETHGTGTPLGDPIEVEALSAVYGQPAEGAPELLLGSVKTNVGHLEGAAGIASVIKTVLALQHHAIPANLHFRELNPHITLQDTRLQVAAQPQAWPGETPRIAAVSSFGWSGTNAHMILEEAPQPAAQPPSTPGAEDTYHLLPVSAHDPAALAALAGDYARLLQDGQARLADVCHAAATRRDHHDQRLAVAGRSAADLADALLAFPRHEARPGLSSGSRYPGSLPGIVFVFPGQGGQWPGMGVQLMQSERVFRQAIERCEAAFRPFVDWSLIEQLNAGAETSRLEQINVVQPVLFAMQVALAELWRAWGVQPGAVIGHSMGEVAAAHVCGALSLEDAARVICTRSQLMRRVSGKGAMAVVGLPVEQTQARIAALAGRLSVAVSNSPGSTVVAGDPQAVESVMAGLTAENVFTRAVKVDVAAHSPHMDVLRPELERALEGITPRAAEVPFYSTVTAGLLAGEALDAAYWGRNLREMVRFGEATRCALNDGNAIFIEMNPHPILLNAIEQSAQAAGSEPRVTLIASTRRGEDERLNLRAGLGSLYTTGYTPSWERVLAPASGQSVRLPHYAWQREAYWLETGAKQPTSAGAVPVIADDHPLLDTRVDLPGQSGFFWQKTLKQREHPALFEHRLNGTALLAASTALELALAAARRALPAQSFHLSELRFERALALSTDEKQPDHLLVTLTPQSGGALAFDLFSRQANAWQAHIHAQVQPQTAEPEAVHHLRDLQAQMQQTAPAPDFYSTLQARNVQMGEDLQGVAQWWQQGSKILARLAPTAQEGFLIAPALLDAGFQLLGALTSAINSEIYMPSKAEQVIPGRLDTPPAWVYAALREPLDPDTPLADLTWLTEDGTMVLAVNGLHLQSLNTGTQISENPADWLYTVTWRPATQASTSPVRMSGEWLILADAGGFGDALAAQIEQQGGRCVRVQPGQVEDLGGVIEQTVRSGRLKGIVHLWSLDIKDAAATAAEWRGCGSAIAITQELAKASGQNPPRLWLVTRSAQPALPGDVVQPAQAPLWGLGRVIAEEQGEFFGGLVDLPAGVSSEAVSALAALLAEPGAEEQLAWRDGQWYAPRFERLPGVAEAPGRSLFDASGAYLITGGLGGIGLELARWMAKNGARRLILMGRTPLPPRAAWGEAHPPRIRQMIDALRELEALGAGVQYASVDVADAAQLNAFLDRYRSEHWPQIRGVFHAAGVIEDRLVTQLDAEALHKVLRPKMSGAWLLHEGLKDARLDFFVLFSSYGSLVGQAGQGNYAAANAFLDALAHARRAQGLPALSINWGAWSGLGFAATPGGKRVLEKLALQGLPAFNAAQGLAALALLLRQAAPQAMVTPVHWGRLQSSGLAQANMWRDLLAAQQPAAQALGERQQTVRETLLALPADEQRPFLQAHIQKTLAQVLRMAPERIEPKTPLGSLGLESLMAVEFRNRLEAGLDLKLSATLVWSYPTLHDLTGFLLEKLGAAASLQNQSTTPAANQADTPAANQADTPAKDQAETIQKVKAMSDEDALQALKNRRKGK